MMLDRRFWRPALGTWRGVSLARLWACDRSSFFYGPHLIRGQCQALARKPEHEGGQADRDITSTY